MNNFNHKEVEQKWLKFWEGEGVYKFVQGKKGKVFRIDTPPPTVSGDMHIGHAFSYSQQDFIARFKRMGLVERGKVFYPFGTDDNGLPTERLVEKLKNVKSKDMSREDFIKLCLKTLKEITPDFIQDWKNLGISADYNIYYSTIDNNSRKISQKGFIELYKKGEVYKKEIPVLWCMTCQTSIAQAELEDKNFDSKFFTIKFKCSGKDLLIATTRPELIPACVAIFVNPKDKRYRSIIGKKARVPLFDFEVPVIADSSADVEKGTGAMMICSYGDKYDVDAVNRHKLHPRIIFNKNGTLNVHGYKDLKIKEARKKIIGDLKNEGFIEDERSINHVVNVHDKCGTEIEFLPAEQWFIRILDKKDKFIELGKKIKWHPEFMHKRYGNWVNGLEWDWNISRERHFGVPFPVWHCKNCNEIIVAEEKELPVDPLQTKKICKKCKSEATPEEKVLDTWATSSLTPEIANSLVKGKVKTPYSLRPQGHDIIRTWAFYTIVRSFLHEKKIPWENIMVSGFVKLEGEKMSKSKGNVIEPRKVLNEYGADALRYWAAGSKLGEDINYQEKELIAGKRLVTKLLNASKFVFMNLKDWNGEKPKKICELDELFLKELNRVIFTTTHRFELYEYSRAKFNAEEFFWKYFCDNYLEIVKNRVYNSTGDDKTSAQYTLYHTLLTILKLFAPIIPFITEEIYQEYFRKREKTKSIHLCEWPKWDKKKIETWTEDMDKKSLLANRWFMLMKFNSEVWKKKKEAGMGLRDEIRGIQIPKELKAFEKDLRMTHNLV